MGTLPRTEQASFPNIDDLYERLAQVGEGTYGKVYKAQCRQTGRLVALKKIRMETEKEGFPVTAAREIKLLKSMRHPNIVQLQQICTSTAESVYLVFEYLEYDLAGLLQHPVMLAGGFGVAQVKCIIEQVLEALAYLHQHRVAHRDLKGSNLLVGPLGDVKLADFGLAKTFIHPDRQPQQLPSEDTLHPNRMMTNRVITLWYRPPELLLGSTAYGPEVDMWGVGCILLELLTGRPVFTGQDEISQLEAICTKLGPIPTDSPSLARLSWLRLIDGLLPSSSSSSSTPSAYLQREFGSRLGPEGIDLVGNLLAMDPRMRISAQRALKHPWFKTDPLPCQRPNLLPPLEGDWHEFECKQRSRRPATISGRLSVEVPIDLEGSTTPSSSNVA